MYMRSGKYLGEYSNNDLIEDKNGDEDFGLDDYEPEFFTDPKSWISAGKYGITLKFDVDDFTQDIFYFCHVSYESYQRSESPLNIYIILFYESCKIF